LRKVVIFSLLALLLLNVAGYYGFFITAKFQNTQSQIIRFDSEEYDPSRVETIKIPLNLAYPVQDNGFERVDGEFQYKGEFYRLIKQRFYEDTLHIICIRDEQQKNIHEALTDYVKTFSDQPLDAKSGSKIKIDFIKDYLGSVTKISHESGGWNYSLTYKGESNHKQIIFLSIPSPPPEV
jgi:hypothetical protein